MSRVSSLYRVQEIDLELHQSQARINEIEDTLAQDEDLKRAEALLADHERMLVEARSLNSAAEDAVASQREKLSQTEATLYGGSVTNPKELQDLQMESESLRRHLDTLEDRNLETMVNLEDVEISRLEASEALDVLQQRKSRQYNQLTMEKGKLIDNLARLDVERQAAISVVAKEDVALYNEKREKLGGRALALLKDGVCSACGVELARSKQQEVAQGDELTRCAQCSRILYAG